MKKRVIIVAAVLVPIAFLAYRCNEAWNKVFPPHVSPNEAILHFKEHEAEIRAARDYFDSLIPAGQEVYIEFRRGDKVDFWLADFDSASGERIVVVKEWDVLPSDSTVMHGLNHLGWSRQTLNDIHARLKAINAISVERWFYDYIGIGYKRSGMGKYTYAIFDDPIAGDTQYNDSCRFFLFEERVSLEYGGGAIAPYCMPDPEHW